MNIKVLLARVYFRMINLLHAPLTKHGANDPYHAVFREFIEITKSMPSPSILEIGSRNVSGITRKSFFPHCENYTGFDIHSGDGVDVVGDAHRLSENFPDTRFDYAYSISVFEHLLFPWKVVMEINRILKTGGHVFISTHPVWPAHELPWDFWRFPGNGFHALFNTYTGFEIVSLTEGLPCKMYSLVDDIPTRNNCFGTLNQGVAVIAKKIGDYRDDLLKWDVDLSEVVDTMYPKRAPSEEKKL